MPWIKVEDSILDHPKLKRFARKLGISDPIQAMGYLVALWLWCMSYAKNGDLSRYEEDEIAEGARWRGDAALFMDALRSAGWLDGEAACFAIHDWDLFGGKLIKSLEADAARKRGKGDPAEVQPETARTSNGHPVEVRRNSGGTPADVRRTSTARSDLIGSDQKRTEEIPTGGPGGSLAHAPAHEGARAPAPEALPAPSAEAAGVSPPGEVVEEGDRPGEGDEGEIPSPFPPGSPVGGEGRPGEGAPPCSAAPPPAAGDPSCPPLPAPPVPGVDLAGTGLEPPPAQLPPDDGGFFAPAEPPSPGPAPPPPGGGPPPPPPSPPQPGGITQPAPPSRSVPERATEGTAAAGPPPPLPAQPIALQGLPEVGPSPPAGADPPGERRRPVRLNRRDPTTLKLAHFLAFYEAYPKHANRVDAERLWDSLGLDDKPGVRTAIHADIDWRNENTDWRKENGQFANAPDIYLRKRKWMDRDGVVEEKSSVAISTVMCNQSNRLRNQHPITDDFLRAYARGET